MEQETEDPVDVLGPSHRDFDAYLPWACSQFQIYTLINITRMHQSEYEGSTTYRPKAKRNVRKNNLDLTVRFMSKINLSTKAELNDMIRISTAYDQANNLVQLKFINNKSLPIDVIKVISVIIKFQNKLKSVVINKGLTNAVLHELSKWLALTNITDVCLDDSVITDGNYDVLLEKGCLKNLSLSRCKINDEVLKKITSNMVYTLPAAKTLTILKLSSNRITDTGAKYLSEALRTNRQLAYLNLSDNDITDDGFIAILDVLQEFPIRIEEMLATKSRYVNYIKEKNEAIAKLMKEIQAGCFDRTSLKSVKSLKKNSKSSSATTNASIRKNKVIKSLVSIKDEINQSSELFAWEDKVKSIVENKMGKFIDPYYSENIHSRDDLEYCYGNNSLAYINLSYNDISYVSVKKLCEVLVKQKMLDRTPRGLVNVSIEGNCLPANTLEMNTICEILRENLALSSKQGAKKSRASKSEPSFL